MMDEINSVDRIKEERTFLHDIAGPIATCTLIADLLSEGQPLPQVATLKRSLEKLQVMIQKRRELLSLQTPK